MKKSSLLKKLISVLLVVTLMFGMVGCGPELNLTEEESRIISEYAAGLLLKYDRNYSGKIVDVTEPEEDPDAMKVVKEEAPIAPVEEIAEDGDDEDGSGNHSGKKSSDEAEITYSEKTIAEALSADGFEITFNGYEAANIYPEEDSEELVFSLQAQNGMELLVLHFNITNNGDSEKLCNVISNGSKYRIIINGEERVNSMKTILLNDLEQYYDVIAGYGMVDSVLVFEVAAGTSTNINDLDLIVTTNDDTERFKLK
ncbi:MAG: hypothetical protein Q4E51_08955 [Lachnospiraceae bacterium]|nr:hypothetical protein [Lachnospiraceae bacterium]